MSFEDFMLTHYTDDDLDKLVKIFEFSCEAQGAKGWNNRLFIALLFAPTSVQRGLKGARKSGFRLFKGWFFIENSCNHRP